MGQRRTIQKQKVLAFRALCQMLLIVDFMLLMKETKTFINHT